MGRKKKLIHFAENETFGNLFQYNFEQLQNEGFPLKGQWNSEFFKNDHPIVLELGCGKGEYTIGLSKANPQTNFIGVDVKGARLWRGLKTARDENIQNTAFVRTHIELIEHYFGPDEVSEIWITFPDPQPRLPHVKRRLTSPAFLMRYRKFLQKDGIIHLKTDSQLLYDFTLETIENEGHTLVYNTQDLYNESGEMEVKNIHTFYEQHWLRQGLSIKYIVFKLRHA